MTKRTTNLIITIILILTIIMLFAFWHYSSTKQSQPEQIVNQPDAEQGIDEETAEEIDTSDWLTYRNEEYGFEFKYPQDWELKNNNFWSEEFNTQIKNIILFTNDYYLLIHIAQKDENSSDGRTGTGAGDFKYIANINIINQLNIEINDLVYNGIKREVFFNGKNDKYDINGYLSYNGDSYTDNFHFDQKINNIGLQIIKSIKLNK